MNEAVKKYPKSPYDNLNSSGYGPGTRCNDVSDIISVQ